MIAVLTGRFIEAMGDEWRLGEQDIPTISKPLCNGRRGYAKVSLHRVEPKAANSTSNMVDEPEKAATKEPDAEKTQSKDTGAEKTDAEKTDA